MAPQIRADVGSTAQRVTEALSNAEPDAALAVAPAPAQSNAESDAALAVAPAPQRAAELAREPPCRRAHEFESSARVTDGETPPGTLPAPPPALASLSAARPFSPSLEVRERAAASETRCSEGSAQVVPAPTTALRVSAVDASDELESVRAPSPSPAPAAAAPRTCAIRPQQQQTFAIRYAPKPRARCARFAPRAATGPLRRWCRGCGIHVDLHRSPRPDAAASLASDVRVAAEAQAHVEWTPPARAGPHSRPQEVLFAVSPTKSREDRQPVARAQLGVDSLSAQQLRSLLIACVLCSRALCTYAPALRPLRLTASHSCSTLRSSNAQRDAATARAAQCEGEAHAMAYAANAAVASAVSSISESVSRLTARAEADADISRGQLAALHAGLALERAAREAAEARALLVEEERAMLFARYAVR